MTTAVSEDTLHQSAGDLPVGATVKANLRFPGVRYKKMLWHGVGSGESWKRISSGEGLKLPSQHGHAHAHDIGDWGHGVYFTDSLIRARIYARPFPDGTVPLVQALVSLDNAILINWRVGTAMDPKHPAYPMVNKLRDLFGDTLHGGDAARARAAVEWRTGLLASGVDGIVLIHLHDTEVVVYDPGRSIKKYRCRLGEPRQ